MADWIDVGPSDLMEGELRGLEIGERLVLLACQGSRVRVENGRVLLELEE